MIPAGSPPSALYDSRGNMLSKKQYGYTTGDLNSSTPKETTTFTYANSGWKDQLVAVNGTPLTYDENGNLLTYGDQTYSWSHGTRLESITDGENEYSYIYDENGIRFSKTANGEATQFAYLGGRLMAQKNGEDVLFFQYGAGGVPLGFVYNGVQYFYVTNQLGDVLGITDDTGDAFVMYSYDEWGNPIQTITRDNTAEQNKIAEINPLRYRGYYYDVETGYYYLQSRYYNPEWGRFISPDAFSYIDNSTRLGFNAYIYCANNPIMYTDPTGYKYVSELGKQIAEIICSIFLVFDASQISEDFAYFVSGILINAQEFIQNAHSWYKDLANDFQEFILTPLYEKIKSFTVNIFEEFWKNAVNGIKNISLKISDTIKISLSYKGNKTSADFMTGFLQKLKNFLNGIFSFSAIDDLEIMSIVTNLSVSLKSITLEVIEIFEGMFSPMLISLSTTLKTDISFNNPDPTAYAIALGIPILVMIMILKSIGARGGITV